MSTTEAKPTITELPGDDINVQGGGKSWRFANGKIVRGPEKKENATLPDGRVVEVDSGTYPEERTFLNGVLRRVWIYSGDGKYGKVHQIEADIETREGMFLIKAKLLNSKGELKPTISSVNFAWCLLQFGKDEALRIETRKGEPIVLENGDKGGCPTYVNCYRIEGNNAMPVYRPRRDKNAPKQTMLDQWAELDPQLRAHPAWKERDVTRDNEDDGADSRIQFNTLTKECQERGWPTPLQAPEDWLDVVTAVLKKASRPASLDHVEEAEWGLFRDALTKWVKANNGATPPKIAAAKERLAKEEAAKTVQVANDAFGAPSDDGYDPFKDI